jgi:hypothetical protein
MWQRFKTLPIQSNPETLFLRNRFGQPVWPIASHGEFLSLSELASLFGTTVADVNDAEPASTDSLVGDELVVGLRIGSHEHELGRLYAHLTNRRYQPIDTAAQVDRDVRPSIVIASRTSLTVDMLDRLYAEDQDGPAPGILFASDHEELRQQVLVRSAAAALEGSLGSRRIGIYPNRQDESTLLPGLESFGAGASGAKLREAANASAGLLSVMTHSDGIDAFFGPLTVCPMKHASLRPDPRRPPGCVASGICHRHNRPLEEMVHTDQLFDVAEISARILIWGVCWGILPEPSVVDSAWSLGNRLASHARLGAVITTWRLAYLSPEILSGLAAFLLDGANVGDAIARFVRSPIARQHGLKFCLLGDPRVSLPIEKPTRQPKSASAPMPVTAPASRPHDNLGELALLKTVVSDQHDRLQSDQHSTWEGALTRVALVQKALVEANAAPASLVASLQDAVLQVLFVSAGRPFDSWEKISTPFAFVDDAERCPACGQGTRTARYNVRLNGAAFRRMRSCVRCGVIEDAPLDFPTLRLTRVSRVRFGISCDWKPAVQNLAGLLLAPPLWARSVGTKWPLGPAGLPESEFEPNIAWPIAPHRADFIWLSGHRFAIASMPCTAIQ